MIIDDKNKINKPINRFMRVVVTAKGGGELKTEQTDINDTNIYSIIEKYGIAERILNTTKIPIEMDLREMPKNIEELYLSKKRIATYFEQLPANVRNNIGTADTLTALLWSGKDVTKLEQLGIIDKYEKSNNTSTNNMDTNNNTTSNDTDV